MPSFLRQQPLLGASIEPGAQPVDVLHRARPCGPFDLRIAALQPADFERGMMRHQQVRAVQHCEHLFVGDLPTNEVMVRKARDPGDPGVDLDLRIFQPDLGRDVVENLAILADPDEHDREFHDAIVVGIEASRLEVNQRHTACVGWRAFRHIRIGPRNGPQDAVIRVRFEAPCNVLVFGIQVFDIHAICLSVRIRTDEANAECFTLFSTHLAGSTGRSF